MNFFIMLESCHATQASGVEKLAELKYEIDDLMLGSRTLRHFRHDSHRRRDEFGRDPSWVVAGLRCFNDLLFLECLLHPPFAAV